MIVFLLMKEANTMTTFEVIDLFLTFCFFIIAFLSYINHKKK